MDRRMWCAVLAKLVSPMNPVEAGAGLASMLPMLAGYPDAMFTEDSARAVCATGRVLSEGVYGPLTRVPTFGELESALGRWWRGHRAKAALLAPQPALALPAPAGDAWTPEIGERVHAVVQAFVAERSFNDPAMVAPDKKVRPFPVSDGALLATYQQVVSDKAIGWEAAAVRVAMLQRKFGRALSASAREMFAE